MEKNTIPDLSVIIPTLNEEETLEPVILKCRLYSNDVIVVDGHSKDKTREIAKKCGARVELDNRRGKGAAMKKGVCLAKGRLVIFIDADGSHDADDIPKIAAKLKEDCDLAIASRMLGGSDELHGTFDNLIRATGSGLMAIAINKRWKTSLTDILNGFRGIKKDVFKNINLKQDGFLIEHEMIINTLKKGYKVGEVASHEYERAGGKSKLPTSQGWKFILHFLGMMVRK